MNTILRQLATFMTVASLAGCTGLQQFPKTSTDYSADLNNLDPDYCEALSTIYPDDGKYCNEAESSDTTENTNNANRGGPAFWTILAAG